MLQGCVPWPEELARRYIEAGVWEGITVAEMIERTARRQPGKVAVIHGETRITYEELVQSAKRLASGLSSLGLRSQDRVVVQLPNCPEFVISLSGVQLHRRDPGDGAARPSPRRNPPFCPVFRCRRLLHSRSRRLVRLPRDGSRDGRRVSLARASSSWSANRGRTDGLPAAG